MQGRNLNKADRRGIHERGLHGAVDQLLIVWDWLTFLSNSCATHTTTGND